MYTEKLLLSYIHFFLLTTAQFHIHSEVFSAQNLKPRLSLEEGKKSDMFSVGIIVGQIFMNGQHPFGGLDALYSQINIREDNKEGLKVCV